MAVHKWLFQKFEFVLAQVFRRYRPLMDSSPSVVRQVFFDFFWHHPNQCGVAVCYAWVVLTSSVAGAAAGVKLEVRAHEERHGTTYDLRVSLGSRPSM